jgi:hypothetical protein
MVTRERIGGNMGGKIASPKMNIEEVAPMIIVVGSEIEGDGDERTDISNGVGEGYLVNRHWEGRGRSGERGCCRGCSNGLPLEIAGRRWWWWGGRVFYNLGLI